MENPSQNFDQIDLESDELFSDSVHVCLKILMQKKLVEKDISFNLSRDALEIGFLMSDMLTEFFENLKKTDDALLYLADEDEESLDEESDEEILQNTQNNSESCADPDSPPSVESSQLNSQPDSQPSHTTSGTDSSEPQSQISTHSEYSPSPKRIKADPIPLALKIKIINISREHKGWSLRTLQNNGCAALTRKDNLARWAKDVEKGGTQNDESTYVHEITFERFQEARARRLPVHSRNLQEWAIQASLQFRSGESQFCASDSWLDRFKKKYGIRQRKVTRYLKPTEIRSLQTMEKVAEDFQNETAEKIHPLNRAFVLNTDQMPCEYRVDEKRTMDYRGVKQVEAYLGDLNRVTHSYTVQYTITASGKLLNKVFVCLQETNGTFGPRVLEEVRILCEEFDNLVVTCSKSGKLSSSLFELYLTKVVMPYVGVEKFTLIVDSWGGQKNPELYQQFIDVKGEPSCEVITIPPGCTSLSQPLDVYFHRQSKILIKAIYKATYLLERQQQISSRRDILKLQSLVHNQLSAPAFEPMIKFAWYHSRLTPIKYVFQNVKQVCLSGRSAKTKCACSVLAFIKCSWCEKFLCFECFYVNYHPTRCDKYLESKESSIS